MLVLLLTACGWLGPASDTSREPLQVGATPQRPARPSVLSSVFGGSDPTPLPPLSASQCGELQSGGGVAGGCVTAEVRCGETLVGHTRGGVRRFDSAFYRAGSCTPDTTDHDGGDERVYRLVMPPGDRRAVVTLHSPCADLDLAAMLWNDPGCPTTGGSVARCEMWPKDGTARESVELVSRRETTWLLVVEGEGAEEGAFGVSVQCFEGLY